MRLIDCFIEIITYTSWFLQTAGEKQPGFEQVKNDYTVLFDRAEQWINKGKWSAEEWDSARFAVCAWVDESVLCSSWEGSSAWIHEQLQRSYHKSTNAGEEFFDRLGELNPEAREVREVYAYCLASGFHGRYFKKEDETLLASIKASNMQHIMDESLLAQSSRGEINLFPGAYKSVTDDAAGQKFGSPFSLFTITFLIWPPVLFGVLFLLYQDVLRRFITDFFGKGF